MTMRKWISLVLAIVLAVGLAYWWQNGKGGFSWEKFAAAGAQVNLGWLSAAAGITLAAYGLRGLRWGLMMKGVCDRPNVWKLITAQFTGFAAVAILGRPGELVRPSLIAAQQGVSLQSQMAIWFLERVFDLLMVMVLFGFSLSQLGPGTIERVGPTLGWLLRSGGGLAATAATGCVLFIMGLRYLSGPIEKLMESVARRLPESIGSRLMSLYRSFSGGIVAMQSSRDILLLLLYSAVHWGMVVAMFYCLCQGFEPTSKLSVLDGMVIYGFIAFGAIVQLPGVGGGIQIVTVLVLTELYGLGLEAAGMMGLLVWAIAFLLSVPLGLIFALTYGLGLGELRGMASDSSVRSQDSSTVKCQS